MTKIVLFITNFVLLLAGCTSVPPSCYESRGASGKNIQPIYPPISRQLKEEGKTTLRVHVNSYGYPEIIELYESSGFKNLDESAIAAVKNWCFYPAKTAGKPVDEWVLVPFNFHFVK